MYLFLLALFSSVAAIPSPALYFPQQRVDHFSEGAGFFSQRYYANESSWGGPGSPIICILGGEGAIEPSTGIFYPSIVELAGRLKALIVEPEHRFYGESQPAAPFDTARLSLLTAPQALADAARFLLWIRRQHNCSGEPDQPGPRCRVITVGGSYPGWLSAMMRLRYPNIVHAAYAASAPMRFYSQEVGQFDYYQVVTASAARASPTCPDAVRAALAATLASGATKDAIVAGANLCTPLPAYLDAGDAALLAEELNMVFMYSFANLNMANYPPTSATGLAAACRQIEGSATPWAAISGFLSGYGAAARRGAAPEALRSDAPCYNLSNQLPSGSFATISSGDWSGVGSGDNGAAWDFETCSLLVEAIGVNNKTDMFVPRQWSLDWLVAHCAKRFNVAPQPRELAELWGFDSTRLADVATRIVFTNGLNDGWSAGGILTNLSDSLLAYNMPNGAHHSDVNHLWPSSDDTPDVREVRELVAQTLERWLAE